MPVFFTHSQPIILMKREITYYSHFHYEAELIYVVSGRYRVISKGVTYDLGEGDIWLGFPFDEHSYVDIGDNVTMLAIFAPEHLGAVGRLLCTRRPGRPVVNVSEFPPGFGDGLVRVAQMWMALNKRNESAVRNYENELLDSRYIGSVTTRETVLAYLSAAIGELLGAMDFISEVMEADQRVIDDLRVLQAQIAEKQQTLETSLAEQQSAKEALAVKNNELRDQRTEATGLIKEMEENEADYKDVLAEIEAEEEKTQKEIVRLSKELAAQQGNTTVTYGGYIWPVTTSKRVTSPFGKRNTGIKGASTNHRGIDIGGVYYSSTVYAAKAGTVIISSSNSVRGQYIVISHGSGNTTTYQHLSKRSVSVGAVVKQGQAIGVTGSSGVGSGPHLHFEITENGQLVNPLKYLTDYVKAWN